MVRQVKIDVWISLVRSRADKIDWLTLVQICKSHGNMLNMHTKHMPSLAKWKAEMTSGLWYVERTKGKAATICNASAAHKVKLKLKRCQGTRKRHIENRKKILRRRKRNLIPSHKISVTIITVSWPCGNPGGENKLENSSFPQGHTQPKAFWLGPLSDIALSKPKLDDHMCLFFIKPVRDHEPPKH